MYLYAEVVALRGALRDCVSIAAAVRVAREILVARDNSLVDALRGYDRGRADVAMEAALPSRSLERCVEEVLLPALEQVACERRLDSAAWAFAAHWGADWLRRATRLAITQTRRLSILVGDASRDELDPDAAHIRALELFSLRAGINLMSLSIRGVAGIGDALQVQRPDLVVIAGGHAANDAAAAWARSVRRALGPIPIALYRPANDLAAMPTTGTAILPTRASDAHHRLIDLIRAERTPATLPRSVAAHY